MTMLAGRGVRVAWSVRRGVSVGVLRTSGRAVVVLDCEEGAAFGGLIVVTMHTAATNKSTNTTIVTYPAAADCLRERNTFRERRLVMVSLSKLKCKS